MSASLSTQVVSTLFVNDYWTLSGTMQTTLLKMVVRAKDIGKHVEHQLCNIVLLVHSVLL